MDFRELVNEIPLPCAVIGVQKIGDDAYGQIRVVRANQLYRDIMGPACKDGILYQEIMPENIMFEQFCYRAAIKGKRGHNYVETTTKDLWTDEIVIPLGTDQDMGYCMVVIELSSGKELDRRASVSKNTAEAVIRASLTILEAEDFKEGLHKALSDMLVVTGAKNSRLFLLDHKNRIVNVFCECVGPEEKGRHDDAVNYERLMSLADDPANKGVLLIANINDREKFAKKDPEWGEIMRRYDVRSVVLMPLRNGRGIYGYLDFVEFDPFKVTEVRELTELLSIVLGSEISNHLLIERLEEMSTTDALTGLKNRNAMHRCMESIQSTDQFGLVSLDLNGLKLVNDRDGHEAGDSLLVAAAEALKKTFYFSDIYRTGGDEFIVLIPGISRESFYNKMDRFRKTVGKNERLSFAIGAVWSDGSMNVNTAFRCADERMYEDKNRYYESHQEKRRSSYDPLTGLPNVVFFTELAEKTRQRITAQNKEPVFLYFNLNGMKLYNEKNGLGEGDRLLKAVARSIEKWFGNDCCGRIGADHFGAVTVSDGLEEKLTDLFRECLDHNEGNNLPVVAGIYEDWAPDTDVSTACDRAKIACDRNRNAFMSGFCRYDAELMREVENRRYIINNLDSAISEGRIIVCYQPIVRSSNGRVCEEEALARWNDPEKGLIMPSVFIPVLEETKLIYKLDLYVLEQILKKMQQKRDAGLYVIPQSINLSRADFDIVDIVEEIRNRVDSAKIPREKLTIEITESMIGKDFDFMREQILRFRQLGFRVWMDDFGAAYSSLDLLQNIQFDLIKLDIRFLQNIEENAAGRIILTELMRLASGLGIDTLAEGVETKEQAEFLREIGCGRMQGFYYGRPLTMEQIEEQRRTKDRILIENPEEAQYYAAIGRINLYDLSAVANDNRELDRYFSSIPISVIEADREGFCVIRCNKTYKEFMAKSFGDFSVGRKFSYGKNAGLELNPFEQAIMRCFREDTAVILDEDLGNGKTLHGMVRRVAVNPVTGSAAMAVAVLGIMDS